MDVSKTPRRGIREIKTLLWVALGLYLLVALFTYTASDPGWSRLGDSQVTNGGGEVGAWLADLLQTLVGRLAFLLPAFCFLQVLWLWRTERPLLGWGWQWLAFIIVLLSGSALISLHFVQKTEALSNAIGGIIGLELGHMMLGSFGLAGSTVLLLTIFLISMTLATGLSWF